MFARAQEKLRNVFTDVAKKYGYETVSVEVIKSREFKIDWARGYTAIHFSLPDFLVNASCEVAEDIAESVMHSICNHEARDYKAHTWEWVSHAKMGTALLDVYSGRNYYVPEVA